jgi:hypothetical protein
MAEDLNLDQIEELKKEGPENLRVKYSTLQAYINSVVTFRFTTLGFFLAAVALILSGTPYRGKYILLCVITFALYLIELRNRFLKNDLGAQADKIEEKWDIVENYDLVPSTIFIVVINKKDDKINYDNRKLKLKKFLGITIQLKDITTHSFALDILYFSVFFYALIQAIR